MNNLASLKILDVFKPLFSLFKIDYPVMRKIVEMKLIMDSRRVPVMFSNQTKKPKGNQFIKSLGIFVLYSLILIPFVFGENYMFQLAILFGIVFFILMTTLISDFSTVLLDVRDKTILGTKPASARTISAAKLVHISIYMIMLTSAFIILPSIVMIFSQGFAFFGLFILMIIFIGMFIISLTSLIYIIVLRFFSAEKLKDMINYIQIIMSLGIVIGYQVVARSFDIVNVDVVYNFVWWHLLIPSFWFAAPFELLLHQNYSTITILLAALAIVIPLLAIGLYYYLMPTFERNLEKLMEQSTSAKKQKFKFSNLWERIVCFSKEERMFFRFANSMMSEEREFKLKVYPALGIGLVFPFILLFTLADEFDLATIGNGMGYLNIYFINIIIGTVVYMLQYSGKYKGAWIFHVAVIDNPKLVYSATLKAFLVKLYLPVYLLVAVVYLFIFSFSILPDLLIVLAIGVIQTLMTYQMMVRTRFPFTEPFESVQQGGATGVKIFVIMIVAGIFALIHFIISFIPFGIAGYLIVLFMIMIFWWRGLFYSNKK